jgi:hypothetical protein
MLALGVAASACGRIHFDPIATDAPSPRLYANTFSSLYSIDPQTHQPIHIADFTDPGGAAVQLGDIAIDREGNLIGVGVVTPEVYSVDATSGVCAAISTNLGVAQYGLGVALVGGREVLFGAGADGNMYRIDVASGVATVLGPFGLQPSGDLAWAGDELLLTTKTNGTDGLASVNVDTAQATTIGDTQHAQVLALAYFDGMLYGLTGGGEVLVLDPTTGGPIDVTTIGQSWVGAASPP